MPLTPLMPLDWALLTALLLSLVIGAWRGLVYEVLSVLGWATSFYAAQWFAPQLAPLLPFESLSNAVRFAAAFVLIFVAALFACGILAFAVKKLVEAVGLRPIDRVLGALFGVVRGVILLLAVAVVINMTTLKQGQWWLSSASAGILTAGLQTLKPMLPPKFAAYLD